LPGVLYGSETGCDAQMEGYKALEKNTEKKICSLPNAAYV
jgi:hypothetical protein